MSPGFLISSGPFQLHKKRDAYKMKCTYHTLFNIKGPLFVSIQNQMLGSQILGSDPRIFKDKVPPSVASKKVMYTKQDAHITRFSRFRGPIHLHIKGRYTYQMHISKEFHYDETRLICRGRARSGKCNIPCICIRLGEGEVRLVRLVRLIRGVSCIQLLRQCPPRGG